MPRFFLTDEYESGDRIAVTGTDAHHIGRVLRMETGDRITLCDGKGHDYLGVIEQRRPETVEIRCIEKTFSPNEPAIETTLYMALPKREKLEWIVQKTVELGITKIVPFVSERCVAKWSEKDAEKKTERLNKMSEAAAKQSGRGRIPLISRPVSFPEMLETAKRHEKAFLAYESEEDMSLRRFLETGTKARDYGFIIGAEGGFSLAEADACKKAGIPSVSLGKRILRCETAPITVLSILLYTADEI